MDNEVSVSDPVDLREDMAAHLPFNYLPAAFSAVAGDPAARNRILLALPMKTGKLAPPHHTVIGADTLADPARTLNFIGRLSRHADAEEGTPTFCLGPKTERPEADDPTLTAIEAMEWKASPDDFDSVVVIVDAGIAFWNHRFRTHTNQSRFREIRFLDFDKADGTLGLDNSLNAAAIETLCAVADSDGSAAVMAQLAASYPNSFYGDRGALNVDTLWHGTAVADLAAGLDPEAPNKVAMLGIELPMSVLRDSDGDVLTAVLAILADQVILITRSVETKHIVVVLPFGFVGGPQDGSHPAARIIESTLAANLARKITFVVPAGNHLQDRCRAQLPAVQGGASPLQVDWQLAPDDFSHNQIEVAIDNVAAGDDRAGLRIAPPGAPAALACGVRAGQYRLIRQGGSIVGMLLRHANVDLHARLRLCVGPTGIRPGGRVPAPHGVWRLSSLSVQPADLWVLRDDRDRVIDEALPRRPSLLDHVLYRDTDATGAPGLLDDPACPVMRSGTLSVLATALGPSVVAVQANERLGTGDEAQAGYSGRPVNASVPLVAQLVDDGWPTCGVAAAANGTRRRVRVSGTSAAAGLQARALLGLGPAPAL